MMRHVNDYLFQYFAKVSHSIANAIGKLCMSDSLRNKIGKAGREKLINDFNITEEAKKLKDVFSSIV